MEESQDVVIKTNKYQTPITKELLSSLEDEVREQFLDAVNNIQFIKNLISPNRPYHKDLPRDERGRAIVDITNPPIMVITPKTAPVNAVNTPKNSQILSK